MVKKLTPKSIKKYLNELSGWEVSPEGSSLTKKFTCESFVHGLAFIARVAVHAEILQHHPHIELSESSVMVTLTTTSVGGISKLDCMLAKRIDAMQSR